MPCGQQPVFLRSVSEVVLDSFVCVASHAVLLQQEVPLDKLRNVAIIAHVDHGHMFEANPTGVVLPL